MKKPSNQFAIPGKAPKSLEQDEADRKHIAELKRKAVEPIPAGCLAALVATLSTKEVKGGRK